MKILCDKGREVILTHFKECAECRGAVQDVVNGFPAVRLLLSKEALKLFEDFLKEASHEQAPKN